MRVCECVRAHVRECVSLFTSMHSHPIWTVGSGRVGGRVGVRVVTDLFCRLLLLPTLFYRPEATNLGVLMPPYTTAIHLEHIFGMACNCQQTGYRSPGTVKPNFPRKVNPLKGHGHDLRHRKCQPSLLRIKLRSLAVPALPQHLDELCAKHCRVASS